MRSFFDVIIVGSSMAGASLALQLGQQGISTALIDQSEFPRRKACGEGISSSGIGILRDLGLNQELAALEGRPFHGYRIWRGERASEIRFSENRANEESGLGVPRFKLDHMVTEAAQKEASIEGFFGCQVRAVESYKDYVRVRCGERTLVGRFLVLADGAKSFLAPRLEVPQRVWRKRSRVAISAVFQGEFEREAEEVSVILRPDIQICCTPTGDASLNVSLLTRKSQLRTSDIRSILHESMPEVFLRTGFSGDAVFSPKAESCLGRVRRAAHWGRVILIGDAVEQLDPIGGMGMTHALICSRLASKALQTAVFESDYENAFCRYAVERKAVMRPLRGFTRLSYASLVGVKPSMSHLAERLEGSSLATIVGRAVHGASQGKAWEQYLGNAVLSCLGVAL